MEIQQLFTSIIPFSRKTSFSAIRITRETPKHHKSSQSCSRRLAGVHRHQADHTKT